MSQIIINTCSLTPNIDALEGIVKFIRDNYSMRKSISYRNTMVIKVSTGRKLRVTEKEHPNDDCGLCDALFEVEKID